MISRLLTCTIDPNRMKEFRAALNNEFLPRIQAQPGFVENIESLDPATGQFTCLTVWKSPADVSGYDKGLFQEVAKALSPLMKGSPTVRDLPVENSSTQRVKAGAATA